MNQEVRLINRNLVSVSGIKSVMQLSDDVCKFQTGFGTLKIVGNNLEILKFDLANETLILSGVFYSISY